MKILPWHFTFAITAAVLLAGCPKTPKRPDPSATIVGPGGSGAVTLNPTAVDTQLDPSAAGLSSRNPGVFEDENIIRGLLPAVMFDFNRSGIRQSERPKIQQAADYLNQNAGRRILIEGRCDWRGTKEYNIGLGDRRAGAVKKYLQDLGIPADRIETLSKGDLDAREGSTADEMVNDRRADMVILKK